MDSPMIYCSGIPTHITFPVHGTIFTRIMIYIFLYRQQVVSLDYVTNFAVSINGVLNKIHTFFSRACCKIIVNYSFTGKMFIIDLAKKFIEQKKLLVLLVPAIGSLNPTYLERISLVWQINWQFSTV